VTYLNSEVSRYVMRYMLTDVTFIKSIYDAATQEISSFILTTCRCWNIANTGIHYLPLVGLKRVNIFR